MQLPSLMLNVKRVTEKFGYFDNMLGLNNLIIFKRRKLTMQK